MKCPKCHYLSFDPEPRCRNCGYTLSLDPDLAINRTPETPDAALADLELRGPAGFWGTPAQAAPPPEPPVRPAPVPSESTPPRRARTPAGPFDAVTPEPVRAATEIRRTPAVTTSELPLFVKEMAGDAEAETPDVMGQTPARPVPSAPPTVRRQAPGPMSQSRRETPETRLGPLDRDLLEGLQRIEDVEQKHAADEARRARLENAAGVAKRLSAAACDAALLAGLSLGIVWITLRWCDLSWSHVTALPLVPFAAFLLLIIVGYLFMFTATTGQTIGKMIAGTRVVDAGEPGAEHRVSVRQAMYRELLAVPAVLVLGLGFLPALTGDERAFHDRLARTRVVRA